MQSISSLTLTFGMPDGLEISRPQIYSAGPFLQGALMERLDSSYVAYLHQQAFNPYSLHCWIDNNTSVLIWRINALTDEAIEQIIEPMQKLDSLYLKRFDKTFEVTDKNQETLPLKSLTDLTHEPGPSRVKVQFLSPTAFKSTGMYIFMPTVRLVFQNLFMRYEQLYEGDKEVDPDTIDYLDRNIKLVSYNLHSHYFSHVMQGNRRIPAFMGSVDFNIGGSKPLGGLARMLLTFGNYAGIGIKTAMGMGGARCVWTKSQE